MSKGSFKGRQESRCLFYQVALHHEYRPLILPSLFSINKQLKHFCNTFAVSHDIVVVSFCLQHTKHSKSTSQLSTPCVKKHITVHHKPEWEQYKNNDSKDNNKRLSFLIIPPYFPPLLPSLRMCSSMIHPVLRRRCHHFLNVPRNRKSLAGTAVMTQFPSLESLLV